MNDSSTGGFLTPSSALPAEDEALDNLLQEVVAGVTGVAPTLVRPRYQPDPPPVPELDVNWIAVGVVGSTPYNFAGLRHVNDGTGSSILFQHEKLEVLLSFYGPGGKGLASLFRDGIQVGQNRDTLRAANIALVEPGPIRTFPEQVNLGWRRRWDMTVWFNREARRTYRILHLNSAVGTVVGNGADETTTTSPFDTDNV